MRTPHTHALQLYATEELSAPSPHARTYLYATRNLHKYNLNYNLKNKKNSEWLDGQSKSFGVPVLPVAL